MSVVSLSTRAHRVHTFHFLLPKDPNQSITKGFVADLIHSTSSKKTGNIILNGFENFIDDKTIYQSTFSLFLDNNSLSFIAHFNIVKTLAKLSFPPRVVIRDHNGKNILIILTQDETDPQKITITLQFV
jgi:hypothetical protein